MEKFILKMICFHYTYIKFKQRELLTVIYKNEPNTFVHSYMLVVADFTLNIKYGS